MKNILYFFTIIILLSSCGAEGLATLEDGTSISGSYARMLALGNRLYVLDDTRLTTFDITEVNQPTELSKIDLSGTIESIFYNGEYLFIGSNEGMHIYSIDGQGIPSFTSLTPYGQNGNFDILPCDPIVANDTLSFSTLRTTTLVDNGEGCGRSEQINQLNIYDIKDVSQPILLSETIMDEPKGLGLDGEVLFVCESTEGLKIFDVSNPATPIMIHHEEGFEAFDVIAYNNKVTVIGNASLRQYDYSDLSNIQLLSIIEF